MKINWDNIKEIADKNAVYLEEVPEAFLNKDVKLTEEELLLLLLLLLDDFETEDGRLKNSRKNFFLVNKVDMVFKTFALTGSIVLLKKLLSKFQKVVKNNASYYSLILGKSEKLVKTSKAISDLVNRRLGIEKDGSIKAGGYVSDLGAMTTVRNETRELFYKNVLSKSKVTDFRKLLTGFIVGEKDSAGAIYKFYSKFAYDSFSQIDRMASSKFAADNGLTQFIYYGIIIPTSRNFCRKKINGIYTIEQALKWPYENPRPIGISELTYNPIIEMGGINCKHVPLFITRNIADDLITRGFKANV